MVVWILAVEHSLAGRTALPTCAQWGKVSASLRSVGGCISSGHCQGLRRFELGNDGGTGPVRIHATPPELGGASVYPHGRLPSQDVSRWSCWSPLGGGVKQCVKDSEVKCRARLSRHSTYAHPLFPFSLSLPSLLRVALFRSCRPAAPR